MFEAVLSSGNTKRTEITKLLEETHKKVEGKQKHDFDIRHLSSAKMELVYKIMLKNKWRDDRKGVISMARVICCSQSLKIIGKSDTYCPEAIMR